MSDTPAKIEYSDKDKPNKTPIVLAVAVAIVAAVISVWGINSSTLMAGVNSPSPLPTPPAVLAAPSDKEETDRLLSVGATLHQQRCAGCHSIEAKLIGPSYLEISTKYRDLSEIGFASTHPKNDWDGYDDGPHLHLDKEQQRAIAVWILSSTKSKGGGND